MLGGAHGKVKDSDIIDLYWQRNEEAIVQSKRKYGKYCLTIASNILQSREDAEECLNDTWLAAWNSIPPNRPQALAPYLGKLCRRNAINRSRKNKSLKRGGGSTCAAFEELSEILDSGASPEKEIEQKEIARAIRLFLNGLEKENRQIFLARYWYAASIEEISNAFHFSQGKIKMILLRCRKELKVYLEGEGRC